MKRISIIATLGILASVAAAEPVGTSFSFQGQLKTGGTSVDGSADFEVSLWDAESQGTMVAGPIVLTNVTVTNGLFVLSLDFGDSVFASEARWLKISVRSPSGVGAYTTLEPRQRLHAAPCALTLPGVRTQQNATSPNIITGWNANQVTAGTVGATVAGGGSPLISGNPRPNLVTDNYGTVSGGSGNRAGDNDAELNDANHATVGGGYANLASGSVTTVGGGWYNRATNTRATVAGGWNNLASGSAATVSGGRDNSVAGTSSVVAGGHGNVVENNYSTIGGGWANRASGEFATIGGGGPSDTSDTNTANKVTDHYGTVSGGGRNRAGNANEDPADANYATVGGGYANTAGGPLSTIAGGWGNVATGERSTVAGGWNNWSTNHASTVGGGRDSKAEGWAATVPGGFGNNAVGSYSFAAGRRAKANHTGTFVWADSTDADFASTGNNQFLIRASGGVGIGTAPDGGEMLSVAGTIESETGGFKFPDGTIQTTAGSGLGLTLPYSGSCPCEGPHLVVPAFDVINAALGEGVRGTHGPSGNQGYLGSAMFGVYGESANGLAVGPPPIMGAGVFGKNTSTGNGVRGESVDGFGVRGDGTTGVFGLGSVYGVWGMSTSGHAGYFEGDVYVNGSVGIGWERPDNLLHVEGEGTNFGGNVAAEVVARFKKTGSGHTATSIDARGGQDAILYFAESGSAYWDIRHDSDNSHSLNIRYHGGQAENESIARFLADGTTRVRVLEIVGGSDLAEPFKVRGSENTDRALEPGTVVVIDPDHPGELKWSTLPYDRKVAGIISGARGLKPGMVMKAEDSEHANGDHPVALTGRVWCRCNAANGPIRPGDLLTTSGDPGHAMRVTDHGRAQGAVLGKAMTSLDSGRGLVLVLVTLQ